MRIDSRIPLSFQPAQIESPLAQYGQMVQLRAMIQKQQQQEQALMRQQQFEAELGAAGDDPEKQIAVARKYGDPKDIMHHAGAAMDRKALREQQAMQYMMRLEESQAARQQKHEEFQQRQTDQRSRDAEMMDYRRSMLAFQQQQAAALNAFKQQGLELRRDQLAQGNKPPAGYRYKPDGTMEPIPGGPADTKLQGAYNQDTSQLQSLNSGMDRLEREASALLKHPGLGKSTGLMSIVPGVGGVATIPGTDVANFKADLETLKSQAGFTVLQEMRNASKTGGALGQVSDFENKMLQVNLASLDRAKSEKEFKESLQKIVRYTQEAKDRLRNAYNLKHSGRGEAPASTPTPVPTTQTGGIPEFATEAEAKAAGLPDGTRVKIGGRTGTWKN